jgi:hypothetical protein
LGQRRFLAETQKEEEFAEKMSLRKEKLDSATEQRNEDVERREPDMMDRPRN